MNNWIWFDLDDTLHDFSDASRRATTDVLMMLGKEADLPISLVEVNYKAMLKAQNEKAFTDGKKSHEYRHERFMAAISGSTLGRDLMQQAVQNSVTRYEDLFMSGLQLKPHAREVLHELIERGYSLCILEISPYFKYVFTSGALGLSKKNGMIDLVLRKVQALPFDVIMVGDSLDRDVKPALKSNLTAVWFNENKLSKDLHCSEIHSLGDLLEVINRKNAI